MKNDSDKRLLLLGGVRPACEIVNEAHKMGVTVYVTDYLENSPAKKIADKSFMVNAMDVDAVAALCKEEKIDGLITGYVDSLLPYAEAICRKAELPFWGDAENIDICINKEKFKAACEKSGVPVVPWQKAGKDDCAEALKKMKLPLVVKPVDNSGSRGVFKCFDASQAEQCAQKALSFSKRGEILIEEAMDPRSEFSVYYIMNHGEYYLTAMGDRYVNIADESIAPIGQGMLFPSVHLSEWKEKADAPIRRFFEDNNMRDGFVFLQGFYKDGGFYIHEIGYRLNGGFSYKIIDHFSGYNQISELIRFSLTGDMDKSELQKSDPFFDGCGMIVTASLKPGTIGEISGIEEIEKTKGVLQFCRLHDAGETLLSHGTTAQVFAYILCAADTPEEMKNIVKTIAENLRVYDCNGDNMLNPMVAPSEIKF